MYCSEHGHHDFALSCALRTAETMARSRAAGSNQVILHRFRASSLVRGARRSCCRCQRARGAAIPVEAHPRRGSVRAGRTVRYPGAHRRPEADGSLGSAGHHREPGRRERHGGRRGRGEERAGRLHARPGNQRHARDELEPVPEGAVRPGQGFRAHHAARAAVLSARLPSVAAGALGEGPDRSSRGRGRARSPGPYGGAPTQLGAELFKKEAKVNVIVVPYKGNAPAVTARGERGGIGRVRRHRADRTRR